MAINIKTTNVKLDPSLDDYIRRKIKGLGKFLKTEDNVHIELESASKHRSGTIKCRAEITVTPKASHKGHYADGQGIDLYAAFDLCLPKIKEQLMKRKDKEVSVRREIGARLKGNI